MKKSFLLLALVSLFGARGFALESEEFGEYDFSPFIQTEIWQVLVTGEGTLKVREEAQRLATDENYRKEKAAERAKVIEDFNKYALSELEKAKNEGVFISDKVVDVRKTVDILKSVSAMGRVVYTKPFVIRVEFVPMESQEDTIYGMQYENSEVDFFVYGSRVRLLFDDLFNYKPTGNYVKKSEIEEDEYGYYKFLGKYNIYEDYDYCDYIEKNGIELDRGHPTFTYPNDAYKHVYDIEVYMIEVSFGHIFHASKVTKIK